MTRPVIDVTSLSAETRDSRSVAWWGNTLFMVIETSTVSLLLASYFYLWRNWPQADWPPPSIEMDPPHYRPMPDLDYSTVNVIVLLMSVVVMYRVDILCRRQFDALQRLNVSSP